MKRIAILTAGGDTPALNATIFGAVQKANELGIEVFGLIKGFGGMISPQLPHVRLNPLFSTIPELDPCLGGTFIGASSRAQESCSARRTGRARPQCGQKTEPLIGWVSGTGRWVILTNLSVLHGLLFCSAFTPVAQ